MIAGTSTISRFRLSVSVLVLLFAVVVAWYFVPAKDWVRSFDTWIQGLGVWGAVVFATVYVIAVVALAPAEIMSIAAGFLFGAWGFPLVVISATIGATLAFLVSRYMVRQRVKALARKRPLFQAVDRTVGQEGWKIVALLRLNPLVPFNLQNYVFGATDIGLVPYTVSTFFGIMPGSAMYVYPVRAGAPSCVTTCRTSQPWICSWFRPSASTCSTFWSSSGWLGESLPGPT